MADKETLADRLEAFSEDAEKMSSAKDHILRTLGGCVHRNIREIVAALREREARLGPP